MNSTSAWFFVVRRFDAEVTCTVIGAMSRSARHSLIIWPTRCANVVLPSPGGPCSRMCLGVSPRSSAAFTRNPIWLRALALPTMSMSWVGGGGGSGGGSASRTMRRSGGSTLAGAGMPSVKAARSRAVLMGGAFLGPAGWGSEQDEQVIHSVGEHRGDADDDVCGLRAFPGDGGVAHVVQVGGELDLAKLAVDPVVLGQRLL